MTNTQNVAALRETLKFHQQRANEALNELLSMVPSTAAGEPKSKTKRHVSAAGRAAMKAGQQKRWVIINAARTVEANRAEAATTSITKMVKKAATKKLAKKA